MKLKNKIIVLTGAAGGFGAHLVPLFLKQGASVWALDMNLDGLKRLKFEIEKSGFEIEIRQADVSKHEALEKIAAELKKKDILPDVWINNAGISHPESFENTLPETFQKILDVNLNGVLNGSRVALKLMNEKQSGIIVNVASVAGHLPCPFLSPYVTSKYAVVGFTKSLQLELYQQASPIKALLVSPGFADTPIMKTNKDFAFPKFLNWMVSRPEAVAKDIVNAIIAEKEDTYPGLSGRAFLLFQKMAPKALFRFSTRMLTARNFKELVGLEGIRSR